VAGLGPGGWARSVRAAGRVTLSRGRTTETFTATELGPVEAAPHLKRYLAEHPRTVGAYFDVGKDGALADFAAEPPWHPVFRLHPTGS
jgi:hypothetical protein